MPSLKQFVSAPCQHCGCDRLIIANVCHTCGASLPLSPRQPEDFDPGLTREARTAARAAAAKARAARLNSRTLSSSPKAVYLREMRARQKVTTTALLDAVREGRA